jgi:hypothetical protein
LKKKWGWPLHILLAYLMSLALTSNVVADDNEQAAEIENLPSNQKLIEQGWVEEKITPSTEWVESIFAPFTHWMEDEIHREQETSLNQINSHNGTLISVQQAIAIVLKNHQGRVLRSQFKTGPPPYYQIKTLSKEGAISTFFVNAFTGTVFIPMSIRKQYQEANDENINR